jgi:hypothetical protein
MAGHTQAMLPLKVADKLRAPVAGLAAVVDTVQIPLTVALARA